MRGAGSGAGRQRHIHSIRWSSRRTGRNARSGPRRAAMRSSSGARRSLDSFVGQHREALLLQRMHRGGDQLEVPHRCQQLGLWPDARPEAASGARYRAWRGPCTPSFRRYRRLGAHGVMAPAQRESGHAERRARSHPAICSITRRAWKSSAGACSTRAISSSFAWKVSPHRAQACASERKPYA